MNATDIILSLASPHEELSHLYKNYPLLSSVENNYPYFKKWLYTKTLPGIHNGSRTIITINHRTTQLGLAILKKTPLENKICTLVVSTKHRGLGVGSQLLDLCIKTLEDPAPLITVPERQVQTLGPLLASRNFILRDVLFGYYRARSSEYVFNGFLTPPSYFH